MKKNKIKCYILVLKLLAIVFLVQTNLVFAENDLKIDDINDYEYIKLKINNEISFNLNFDQEYKINNFQLKSYFLPYTDNYSQYLNEFSTNYENKYDILRLAKENDDAPYYLKFNLDENDLSKSNKIENEFIVQSLFYKPEVNSKVIYPIKEYESNLNIGKYLGFGNLIDTSSEIEEMANEIARGRADVYEIAYESAIWISEYINYDLSTVTNNPNQKSSDVFKSRAGVCKEITNLYVSVMRSLGIPARVVSGYAYTNSEEVIEFSGSNWGGHAWAEVLIGDKWVPFDLTYKQYGYVDASHIVLDRGDFLKNSSVEISSNGYGINFVGSANVKNDFQILEKAHQDVKSNFNVFIDGQSELGFGSYGYLEAEIENLNDYYDTLDLRIVKITAEDGSFMVDYLDETNQKLLIGPNEKKKVYFRYKITNNLDRDKYYIFPFTLYLGDVEYTKELKVQNGYEILEKDDLPSEVIKNSVLSSNKLDFICDMNLGEKNKINCDISNINNYEIKDLKICFKNNCQKLDLNINDKKSIEFTTFDYLGEIKYNYSYYCKTSLVEDFCFDNGIINVNSDEPELVFSKEVDFEKEIFIFDYAITNFAKGCKVNIYLNDKLNLSSSSASEILKVNLEEGTNNLTVELKHNDVVFDIKSYQIIIEEKSWLEKVILFLADLLTF